MLSGDWSNAELAIDSPGRVTRSRCLVYISPPKRITNHRTPFDRPSKPCRSFLSECDGALEWEEETGIGLRQIYR